MSDATSSHWLRDRDGDESAEVSPVELFFDLVFVFAITQLSHYLLENLTAEGLVRTALLFVAVWWVWLQTAWMTNWLDPNRIAVRLLLFAMMLAGLMMSVSLPGAFDDRAFSFALAYVAMQFGRAFFMIWALTRAKHDGLRTFQRVAVWLILAGGFWMFGAFAEADMRIGLWALAVGIEVLSPSIGHWVPGLGRSKPEDWDVEGPHLAERCGLFIIIALGELLLVTGATLEGLDWSLPGLAAFAVALMSAIAMWWVYFDTGAKRGEEALEDEAKPGRLAQLAYAYIHMPIVAGIVISAVGDEMVLVHPLGETDWTTAATIIGAPTLFLGGNLLFKAAVTGKPPLSHWVGLGLLALMVPSVQFLPPLGLTAAATGVLIIVAALEHRLVRATSGVAKDLA